MNNINAIKFISEGASIISLVKVSNPTGYSVSLEYLSLEYSNNGTDWSTWDLSGLTINSGDALYIRGNNPRGFNSNYIDFHTFSIKGDKVSCSGNIMSLIDYKNLPNIIPCEYCFCGLFKDCTALTSAPELPATELAESCYERMFSGCSSLTTAPELPATRLANSCYYKMFSGCTALTTAPELPATELTESCYESMFSNCFSLTSAPELPATKLIELCYAYMFKGCTSLAKTPALPAKSLANSCFYTGMFFGCTALKDEQFLSNNI